MSDNDLKTHPLVILVCDNGEPSLSATVSIDVVVFESAGDVKTPFRHAPIKEESFSDLNLYLLIAIVCVSVIFLLSLISLLAVKCHRTDSTLGSALLSYHISEPKGNNLFRIGTSSGEIRTKRRMSDNDLKTHPLVILVCDNGEPSLSATVSIDVVVVESAGNNLFRIGTSSGEIRTKRRMSDNDLKTHPLVILVCDNGEPSLSATVSIDVVVVENAGNNLFRIGTSSGEIRTKRRMSDNDLKTHPLVILVCDNGEPSLSATVSIDVVVAESAGNNLFRIGTSSGEIRTKRRMSDNDLKTHPLVILVCDNGEPSLSATVSIDVVVVESAGNNLFRIGTSSGEIRTKRRMSDNDLKTHPLVILVCDNGEPSLSATVSIDVVVVESAGNNLFRIGTSSGEIRTKRRMSDNDLKTHPLVILVCDNGEPSLSASVSIDVVVVESAEPKGNSLFRIGTSSGEIRTKRRMSDNDLKTHPLVILVSDNGEPSLSATVSIDVVVIESAGDVKTTFRHAPMKEENFSDLNLYLLIAIVCVSIIFLLSLISLIAVKCHRTDSSLGRYSAPMITTHPDGSWSYSKSTQQYDVCFSSDTLKSDVVVFPAPFPPADAELISINGGDTFTRTQTLPNKEKIRYSIQEELESGTVVGDLVRDLGLDLRKLSARRIRISSDSARRYFNINHKTGKLVISDRIDRETLCEFSGTCTLSLDVVLENPYEQHNVDVEILDANDNSPLFPRDEYQLEISEGAQPGARFSIEGAQDSDDASNSVRHYRLTSNEHLALDSTKPPADGKHIELATDPDAGENARITYTVLNDNNHGISVASYVSVKPASGEVYALRSFDFEKLREFHFQVKAQDNGVPPLSRVATVYIYIMDSNDHSPQFVRPGANGSHSTETILRNSEAGVLVSRVLAWDLDAGENAWLLYNLHHPPELDLFKVHEYTGEIRTTRRVNEDNSTVFSLTVHVRDHGLPPRSASTTINIAVMELPPKVAPDPKRIIRPHGTMIFSHVTLYLIIALSATTFVFLLTIFVLAIVRCHAYCSQPDACSCSPCCGSKKKKKSTMKKAPKDGGGGGGAAGGGGGGAAGGGGGATGGVTVQQQSAVMRRDLKVEPHYIEVRGNGSLTKTYCYKTCLTATSGSDTFMFYNTGRPLSGTWGSGADRFFTGQSGQFVRRLSMPDATAIQPKAPNADWRYSASLRAGMQSSVHMEESSVMQGAQGVLVQNWPTVSSAPDNEGGEVSPPVGAGVDSNSWHFRYGPGPGGPPHLKPGEVPPEAFIIPGSPAIISIRQGQDGDDKSDFITFGKKEEAKKKKKKKKEKEKKDKREKGKDDDD
ncbi:protocadherin alpha-C2-like isoform X1 [Labeo rohita]|uniref:Protocadherin alpha-C2-like isoform X1 n=2 Tax=Labeonini TaxID=2743697 RepID=A0A498MUZ5_LABRO|nr:protocadherin alpha-C2-like isoform X1 [Labeo rohita]